MTLIVIDGLDAAGKNTQALALYRTLRKNARTVCLRLHPSVDNVFGIKARQFLYSTGIGAHFAAAIFYMLDVIRSVLLYSWQDYEFMIFVRYLMGTAYLPSPFHRLAYHFFTVVVPISEFMFFLDIRPEMADRRLRDTRSQLEMFERLDQLRSIRAKALSLAKIGRWKIVDAEKSPDHVAEEIAGYLCPLFLQRKKTRSAAQF